MVKKTYSSLQYGQVSFIWRLFFVSTLLWLTIEPVKADDREDFVEPLVSGFRDLLESSDPTEDSIREYFNLVLYPELVKGGLDDRLAHHWWDEVNDEERKTFSIVVKVYLLERFMRELKKYAPGKITKKEFKKIRDDKTALVLAVESRDSRDMTISWWILKKDGKYSLFDLRTRNSSLLRDMRGQYLSVFRDCGFPNLISRICKILTTPPSTACDSPSTACD